MTQITVTGNEAYDGGGMYLSYSSPTMTQITVTGNEAGYCGGMYLSYSSPTMTQITVTGNEAGYCGGMYLVKSSPTIHNTILAYNTGFNLYSSSGSATITWSALYSPEGAAHNLSSLGASNLLVEPEFLEYAFDEALEMVVPTDLHLALTSPRIDAGDTAVLDPDGSRSDIGAYGGPGAGLWDVDGDGWYDYFWPGTFEDAPKGYEPADWDCDDLDPSVAVCK